MSGLIGKKLGMTSVFDDAGNDVVCTVLQVGPCHVTQVKTAETDGYEAVQLGFQAHRAKSVSKALQGHFESAGVEPQRKVMEFRDFGREVAVGDQIRVDDVFARGDVIHVAGTSKGKGFQGVVKRHGFSGVGMRTHGQHNRERAPGSLGQSSDPSRVFKGMRMGGRTGGSRVKMKNLTVVGIFPEHNVLLVKGAVPGPKNGFVEIRKK